MSQEAVARRYGRAIFELGKEGGELAALVKQIGAFSAAYRESEELQAALGNPLVSDASRETILLEIAQRLGVSELGQRSLRLMLNRRRLSALPELAAELMRLHDEDGGVLRATVTSAGPLSSVYLERLRNELERSSGKKVVVTHEMDPALIAGVVTKVGDRVIDGSIRAKLAAFRQGIQTN